MSDGILASSWSIVCSSLLNFLLNILDQETVVDVVVAQPLHHLLHPDKLWLVISSVLIVNLEAGTMMSADWPGAASLQKSRPLSTWYCLRISDFDTDNLSVLRTWTMWCGQFFFLILKNLFQIVASLHIVKCDYIIDIDKCNYNHDDRRPGDHDRSGDQRQEQQCWGSEDDLDSSWCLLSVSEQQDQSVIFVLLSSRTNTSHTTLKHPHQHFSLEIWLIKLKNWPVNYSFIPEKP